MQLTPKTATGTVLGLLFWLFHSLSHLVSVLKRVKRFEIFHPGSQWIVQYMHMQYKQSNA